MGDTPKNLRVGANNMFPPNGFGRWCIKGALYSKVSDIGWETVISKFAYDVTLLTVRSQEVKPFFNFTR